MADQDILERERADEATRADRQTDAPPEAPREDARRSEAARPQPPAAPVPAQPRRSRRGLFIFAFIVLALIVGSVWYWFTTKDLESTDDAYTDGYAISMAPQVSGQVIELAVRDNQFVHKGDVLVRIDPRTFVAQRDQYAANLQNAQGQLDSARYASEVAKKNFPAQLALAQAQLAAAKATLFKAQADARRQHAISRGATTQQDVDNADAALMSAQAQVQQAEAQVQQASPVEANIGEVGARVSEEGATIAQAKAQLAQAELNIEWATVRAPADGWVTKRSVDQGDYLQAGQAILSLVTPQVWVTANFKETQLDRMRPGQKVDLSVDAYPDLKLTGHVDSEQLGTGSKFTAFPAENATGNFVKIVQRVPVKIDIDSGLDPNLPLPLGASVTPTVHLK
jgi:membrane fusion protein (multidrug efflux system)